MKRWQDQYVCVSLEIGLNFLRVQATSLFVYHPATLSLELGVGGGAPEKPSQVGEVGG